MTGSAKQSISPPKERMDCFVASLLAMWCSDFKYGPIFSRRDAPEVLHERILPRSKREEGMPGARCTRGLVCKSARKETHMSIQVQRKHSGIPRAMVLRLISRSPRRRIRLVTVAAGLMAHPIRSDRFRHRQLGTSNGCRDHTVLPYAAPPVVCALCSLTDQGPPCEHHHAPDAAASTASRPNVRDDGQRPSTGT